MLVGTWLVLLTGMVPAATATVSYCLRSQPPVFEEEEEEESLFRADAVKEEEEEEGLFKADAVNEEDPEREEEGSSALLCIARMRPGVRAVVCVIFGLEDSSAHAAVEPKTEGLSNLRFHGAGGVSSEPLLVS
jgi:hypothetical protein